jgi:hypothetical protein
VNIFLAKLGEVSQSMLDEIWSLINESYRVLGEPMGGSIDLEIFETSEE